MKNSQPYTQSKFYTNSRSQQFNQHQSNEGCVARILSSKSHYSTLGVDSTCSSPGIKRAYRQLALACHPDRNKTPGAVRAFQAVGRAYEVLSDRELRRQYDRTLVEERRKRDFRTQEDFRGCGSTRTKYYYYQHNCDEDANEDCNDEEENDIYNCGHRTFSFKSPGSR